MSKRLEHDGARGGRITEIGDATRSCIEIDALLEPYLDDVLDPGDRARVERHLDHCGACAAQLQLARDVRRGLRTLARARCPERISAAAIGHARRTASTASTVVRPPKPTPLGRWRLPVGRHAWQPMVALAAATALAIGLSWQPKLSIAPTVDPIDSEVAQAEADIKLALAYLGRMGEQTGTIVRDNVFAERVASPVVRSIREALQGENPSDERTP